MAFIGEYILTVNKTKPFSRISTKNRNPDSGAQQRYDGKKDYNELLFVKKDLTDDFVDLVQSNKGEKGVEEYLKKNPLKESIKLEEYGSVRPLKEEYKNDWDQPWQKFLKDIYKLSPDVIKYIEKGYEGVQETWISFALEFHGLDIIIKTWMSFDGSYHSWSISSRDALSDKKAAEKILKKVQKDIENVKNATYKAGWTSGS